MPTSQFLPSASYEILQLRASLLRQIRQFFDQRGFIEVETPILSADTVVDRHLDPLPVTLFSDPREPKDGPQMWLQTSPEFAMKRLLAAGASAIYQTTHAFRGGEVGPVHNPEFTIIEWYRTGDDLTAGIELLANLVQSLLRLSEPCQLITYSQAFQQILGLDPMQTETSELAGVARTNRVVIPEALSFDDRDAWLDLILSELIAPHLGQQHPVIVSEFPASQSALARVREGNPPVAERFELFIRGLELANGYHELLDPNILRQRQQDANRHRNLEGKYLVPEDNRLLAAMEYGLPPCSGVALGFDRLVMIAAGTKTISEVMAFPIDRA